METVINSDIFFFITSIFVVVLTIVLIIASFYIVKILKNFTDVSESLKNNVNKVGVDVRDIISNVKESSVFRFLFKRKEK